MNPRPITRGHLWLAFALPSVTSCKASVFSRLQRAVSVREIALPFLQRSIRGSVSGRYPFIPLLRISVRKKQKFICFSRCFYPLPGSKAQLKFISKAIVKGKCEILSKLFTFARLIPTRENKKSACPLRQADKAVHSFNSPVHSKPFFAAITAIISLITAAAAIVP